MRINFFGLLLNMAIWFVDLPIVVMVISHSFLYVYQRVTFRVSFLSIIVSALVAAELVIIGTEH